MEDIDTVITDLGSNDAIGESVEYIAQPEAESGSSAKSVEQAKQVIIIQLEKTIERLESLVAQSSTPTLENYLELSNFYLALGTITKNRDTLQKAVDRAEEVIRLKERDRPIVEGAEQNKRAAFDRINGYSYSAVSTAAQIVSDAADMFNMQV